MKNEGEVQKLWGCDQKKKKKEIAWWKSAWKGFTGFTTPRINQAIRKCGFLPSIEFSCGSDFKYLQDIPQFPLTPERATSLHLPPQDLSTAFLLSLRFPSPTPFTVEFTQEEKKLGSNLDFPSVLLAQGCGSKLENEVFNGVQRSWVPQEHSLVKYYRFTTRSKMQSHKFQWKMGDVKARTRLLGRETMQRR